MSRSPAGRQSEAADVRLQALRRQVRYCYESSPGYYRPKMQAAGIRPQDIRSWADFRAMPTLLTKDDERGSQEASLAADGHAYGQHLCCPPEAVRCVCSTSGTTGMPTYILYSEEDMATTAETWFRVFRRILLAPGDRVANLHALSMTGLGEPLTQSLLRFGAATAAIGAEARSDRILHYLQLFRPRALFGTPALIQYLIERSPEVLKRPVSDLGVEIIVCTGAPGAGVPEIRRRIREEFGARLYDAAGGSQGIHNISCEAEPYQGMHVLTADLGIWSEDLVEPTTKRPLEIRDGVVGEALLTALEQRARPALKFALGDILQVNTSECSCGQPGPRIKIIGRADDMLNVLGVNLHPVAVWDLITRWRPATTGEMRIVLREPGVAVTPPIELLVEHGASVSAGELAHLAQRIADEVHVQLKVRANVILVSPGSLERAAGAAAKGALIERRLEGSKE